ncbi:carbohydrate ABC transporter permease [Cohnella fermenti]|uniref:Sugar ABC transporter permease n=1 Tax=Cohnella fermenti TaxID=2565925 RepID=A0A4S4BRE4_9BACL|nr:sugar ABC transporter permease [Cohnella fermenti]THF77561.1 sugar ABC transporter permease [Cohnella fermenti]
MKRQQRLLIATFTLPSLLLYAYFFLSPIGEVVYYSFFDWDAISPKAFIALDNFKELFADPVFYRSLLNTLHLLAFLVLLMIPVALLLAYLLYTEVRAFKFLRTVYFIPVIVSSVATALMFQFIYENYFGILNTLLRKIGLGEYTRVWLSDPATAMSAVSMPLVWGQLGLMMIILLAGLQGLSPEVLEAAEMDGANAFRKLTRIIIPMISGVIGLCLVLAITSAFKTFDFILILTQGGPLHRTEVTGSYMYSEGFNLMNYGYGSAIAVSIMGIAVVISVLVKQFSNRMDR